MTIPADVCLSTALKHFVEMQGVTVSKFAQDMGVSYQHVNEIVKGKRKGSLNFFDDAASYFHVLIEDMISAGRRAEETGVFFPYHREVSSYPANSLDRAVAIARIAAKSFGLDAVTFFRPEVIPALGLPGWNEYLAREIEDEELYRRIVKDLKLIRVTDSVITV